MLGKVHERPDTVDGITIVTTARVAGSDGSLQRVEAATIYRCSETGGHVLALNEG